MIPLEIIFQNWVGKIKILKTANHFLIAHYYFGLRISSVYTEQCSTKTLKFHQVIIKQRVWTKTKLLSLADLERQKKVSISSEQKII